jgi:hypothetical protein
MVEAPLPDLATAEKNVLEVAMKVKEARRFAKKDGVDKIFVCNNGAYDKETGEGGCFGCRPYEQILVGDAAMEYVGIGGFSQDMYIEKFRT